MIKLKHLEPGRPARRGQLILERRFRITTEHLGKAASLSSRTSSQDLFDILDIGCGNGAQTVYFKDLANILIGIDITHPRETEEPVSQAELKFTQGRADKLPFMDEAFSLVTSFEVLEHVDNDVNAVKEIARVLRPKGKFFCSLPNKWWIFESHGATIPGLNWLPWNRIPLVGWLPSPIHSRIAKARIYTLKGACSIITRGGLTPIRWGYITAPLDVLPAGIIQNTLRRTIFKNDTCKLPFLAVNLFVESIK